MEGRPLTLLICPDSVPPARHLSVSSQWRGVRARLWMTAGLSFPPRTVLHLSSPGHTHKKAARSPGRSDRFKEQSFWLGWCPAARVHTGARALARPERACPEGCALQGWAVACLPVQGLGWLLASGGQASCPAWTRGLRPTPPLFRQNALQFIRQYWKMHGRPLVLVLIREDNIRWVRRVAGPAARSRPCPSQCCGPSAAGPPVSLASSSADGGLRTGKGL